MNRDQLLRIVAAQTAVIDALLISRPSPRAVAAMLEEIRLMAAPEVVDLTQNLVSNTWEMT